MKYVYLAILSLLCLHVSAEGFWLDIPSNEIRATGISERKNFPEKFRSLRLDLNGMKSVLNQAVNEDLPYAYNTTCEVELPLPDGKFGRFKVAESNLLPDPLRQAYYDIRTFTASGIDDPTAIAKIDYTVFGFHAMIMSPSGWVFIDPVHLGNTDDYLCYYRRDSRRNDIFYCGTSELPTRNIESFNFNYSAARSSGTTLKTYRLALACTGEYAAYYGGTKTGAFSGMVTSVNRVDGVYQLEVAVRLTLIPNDTLLIYLDAATDPYTNNSGSTMLGQNQTNITNIIGSANYDIGHVFSTGGGGVAGLGVVCSSTNKARGVTGSSAPIGDNFDIDYVAHEMGHQYGGNHTFNSITGSCSGNRAASAAYEVGSGTTIMAYAGICGADNTQPHSDPIFHAKSYDEIQTFISTGGGSTCPVSTATGNTPPTINAGSNFTIPFQTPFVLTGSATDPDNDVLTYLWEQYDLGSGSGGTINAASTTDPIFRDFVPLSTPSRTFPKMSDVVNNVTTFGEVLPTVARNLNFKFTARDNRTGGGGVTNNNTNVVLTVVNTTTPFRVTAPNTAVTWFTGTTQAVTWDVSGTNGGTINCANVSISLSTDGGFTYPITLAASVPNTGSASITVPTLVTTTARVRVAAVGNIFFDISNVNFSISTGSASLTTLSTNPLASSSLCAGAAVNVDYTGDGPASSGNVYTAQLSNAAGSFTSPVTIGTLTSPASSGTIACVIPSGTTQGTGYRIRVISSSPAITGSNNGTNLSIFNTVGAAGSVSGATTVCQGQTGVVYSVPAISNATTYIWNLPSGATITAGSNTNSITVTYSASATSGNVSVTGSNSCLTGTTSASLSVTVNVIPVAAGAITTPFSACQGQSVSISVPAIANATSYSWTLPSGTILTGANTNSVTASFSSTGTITIQVAGTNACGNGAASSALINIGSTPAAPSITPSGAQVSCNGNPVFLSYSATAGVNYQWQLNGTDLAGETFDGYYAGVSGAYSLVATQNSQFTSTYNNSTAVSITDNSCTASSSTINVSGYTSTITSSQIQVRINITHTWVGDLVILLQAPNGSLVGLSNQTGSSGNSGDNFINTVFTDAAAAVLPTTGAPYTGSYKPVATTFTVCTYTTNVTTFAAIGGGVINPNGNWTLLVLDRASADVGTINNWSLIIPSPAISCTATSNVVNVSTQTSPVIFVVSPVSGSAGTVVTINGSGFSGTTSVTFNGLAASFTVVNDGQITATAPVGVSTGLIQVTNACGNASGFSFSVGVNVTVRVLIEGFYRGSGQMIAVLGAGQSDTITISLASSTSPYGIVSAVKGVMDLSGNCTVTFPSSVGGNSYYIQLNHRNALETWSALPVMMNTAGVTCNFTSAASQAYGGNMIALGGGFFGLRSGDVNQDGFINLTDISLLQIATSGFSVGYIPSDLTGDSVTESADFSLLENNVAGGYSRSRP